ncbi:MAG TPA: hypothetical protein VEZ12_15375 [Herpetosiphonaceae bacterium]|nr:hypothetical protein [Herpetosiphonaceae bacterium]
MRRILIVVGIFLLVSGGVWFLQGINILLGSAMTGQTRWAVNGAIAMLLGLGLLLGAFVRRGASRGDH